MTSFNGAISVGDGVAQSVTVAQNRVVYGRIRNVKALCTQRIGRDVALGMLTPLSSKVGKNHFSLRVYTRLRVEEFERSR